MPSGRRRHAVLGHEILARTGVQLPIARVVDCLDARGPGHHRVTMRVGVLDQLRLGLGRPDDQDLPGARQRIDDGVMAVRILSLAAGAQRATFGMQVGAGLAVVGDRFLDIVRADVHGMGLRMIEPGDSVVMVQGATGWSGRSFQRKGACTPAV